MHATICRYKGANGTPEALATVKGLRNGSLLAPAPVATLAPVASADPARP